MHRISISTLYYSIIPRHAFWYSRYVISRLFLFMSPSIFFASRAMNSFLGTPQELRDTFVQHTGHFKDIDRFHISSGDGLRRTFAACEAPGTEWRDHQLQHTINSIPIQSRIDSQLICDVRQPKSMNCFPKVY